MLEAEKISTAFTKVEGLENLLEKLTLVKERVETVKTEVDSINTSTSNVAKATVQWSEALATVSPNFQNMMHSMEMIQAKTVTAVGELGSLLVEEGSQIKTNTTYYEQELQVARQFKNAQEGLISGYAEIGAILDRFVAKGEQHLKNCREEMKIAKQLGSQYMEIAREKNRQLTYEKEMLMVEEQFSTVIGDEIASKFQYNSIVEQSGTLEKEILALMGDKVTMTGEEIAEETKKINALRQELDLAKEIAMVEKEEIGLIAEETAEIERLNAQRMSGVRGNKLDKMGYLPSRISSMAITMLGYQEIMDVWQKTTSNINAKTQFNSYADLLKTDNRYLKQTNQSTADVTKGINELNYALTDTYKNGKNLQQMYSKVDMRQVGANALDTAFKYGVQAENLDELTEVMAIYSSEFVRQGRSQEDSILAVNDALDGEFRRLKEVNIGKKELEEHGYEQGDTLSLIRAMREIAEERGYDVTAQKITTLSEAITQAELELAFLLSDLFELAEPSLIYALGKVVELFRFLGQGVKQLKDYLKGLPQPVKDFLKAFGGNAMLGLVGLWVGRKIFSAISNIELFGNAWTKLMQKMGRTKGMDKATESLGNLEKTTTGGTVGTGTGGTWKDGLKNWGKNLAKNLGKMAEVFIEVAVALAMAWALMKEAIILIEDLGKDFEAHKEGFNKGWAFLKEYGVWILGVSAVLVYVLDAMSKTPMSEGAYTNMAKSGLKIAEGLAIAMGLIAEAIILLILPMKAIEGLGWLYGMLNPSNIQKGYDVIGLYADALDYIASNDNIGYFIIGLTVVSAILGFTADTVGLAMAIGIASALLLVSEAIVMLIAPLKAIEILGNMASSLDANAVKQGANAIKTVGECLQALEPSVRNILAVDFEVFGIGLVEKGNQIVNGKDGFKALTEDILPNLFQFVKDVSNLEVPSEDVSSTVATITQIANSFAPMVTAIQKLTGLLGGDVSISFMGFQIESNSGIRGQLDKLYEDISAVMDFANKLGKLKTTEQVGTTAITQTADAITQLKAKLDQFVTTISTYSNNIHTASDKMGKALPNGFKSGASTFSATVVQVLASGISEVQARYPTMKSGGKALGSKLVEGYDSHTPKLKTSVANEIKYALEELDGKEPSFYDKGAKLGSALSDGFESTKGLNVGSPAKIARAIAKEMEYSLLALDNGKMMMYRGGQALGNALATGYAESSANLRTNVDVLAQKGVSNEQLQATARNIQANTNKNQQVPQISSHTINIDMSNSMVIGVQDLDDKIKQAVEKAIVNINSPNGAIGY